MGAEGKIDVMTPVQLWPVKELIEHPENPRTVNARSDKFGDLVASIRANGILEPLTVRRLPLVPQVRQVLSGHRRLVAARQVGLVAVPVRDLGAIPDDLAYDIVAMANLHEDLTPLEEGKRASVWLDKYGQDVRAVASKLGKTESWVVQHAEIARGLSAEWQQEILEATDGQERPKWSRWTAGHLAVIARLPASLQAHYLQKVHNDYRFFSWPDWTIGQIEEAVKLDLLYLAKAPFDEGGCGGCVDRTDWQPLLFGDTAEESTGDKARCLNKACYDKKCRAAERERFEEVKQKTVAKLVDASGNYDYSAQCVPLCLVEEPKDYQSREGYRNRVSALKKTFPKLVTADRVEIVKEGAKGAVPGIVVAGDKKHKKNAVVWVKVSEKKADRGGGGGSSSCRPESAAEIAERKAREEEMGRKRKLLPGILKRLLTQGEPDTEAVLYLCLMTDSWPGRYPDELGSKERVAIAKAFAANPAAAADAIISRLWEGLRLRWKKADYSWNADGVWKQVVSCGPLFGIDPEAELAALTPKAAEAEPSADSATSAVKGKRGRGRPKGVKDAKPRKRRGSHGDAGDFVNLIDPVDDGGEEEGGE